MHTKETRGDVDDDWKKNEKGDHASFFLNKNKVLDWVAFSMQRESRNCKRGLECGKVGRMVRLCLFICLPPLGRGLILSCVLNVMIIVKPRYDHV